MVNSNEADSFSKIVREYADIAYTNPDLNLPLEPVTKGEVAQVAPIADRVISKYNATKSNDASES